MAQADGNGEEETMARRLYMLRVSRRWTQEEAAEKAATSQAQLSRLELGLSTRPPIEIVARLADVYGVTIDYLWHGNRERERVSA